MTAPALSPRDAAPELDIDVPVVVVPDPTDDSVMIRDFTIKKKYVKFKIDEDIFTGHTVLGLPLMQELITVSKGLGKAMESEEYDSLFDIFDRLLVKESAQRFRQRATSAGDDGIDVKRQLLPIIYYLLEEFGIRPTRPSSDSPTGSPSGTGGTTSTAGSSGAASTSPS